MRFVKGCIVGAILFPAIVQAQMSIDDTIRVDEVAIYSTYRQSHTIGTNSFKVDSLKLKTFEGRNLSELLQSSGASIRTYGVGGLSSIALRGGSSVHTAVVWNGINLQSPMNGGVNLSQLPTMLFNSIKVQHGGNGTIYGSGAISGIVILESKSLLQQPNGIEVGTIYGDGHTRGVVASGKYGTQNLALSLKYNGTWADNDFEFINTYKFGNPRERISNAQAKLHGLMADVSVRIGQNSLWNFSGWLTSNDKNVQTLMSSYQASHANQVDNNYALSSNLVSELSKFSVRFKNAYVNAKNRYEDSTSNIYSNNRSKQLINEIELKKEVFSKSEIVAGVGHTIDMAKSDSYIKNAVRNRISAYASMVNRFFDSRVTVATSVRDELVDGDFIPVVASGGVELEVFKWMRLKASAATSYRLPTLNDLYWATTTFASGNPDLKPEHGWNADGGADFIVSLPAGRLSLSVTYYITELNDWIVWLPDANDNGRWKPDNFNHGKSNGIEGFLRFNIGSRRIKVISDLSYTYTNSKVYDIGDYDGKPMIYVPRHRVGGSFSLSYNGFSILYTHSFASERYTDDQNKLPYYNLGDAVLAYNFSLAGSKASISVGINNVWNEQYQLMRNYAMPLRNYFVRLNVEIQSKSTR
ncbi:TonB-dependent receptor plug domain-containing protein [Tenuifilum thalassicum]|uniref:TonB-dependent receptor n=1 Tax=Tenuifilum thalassicum TaxID=2590900 RepID=A0A7D4C0C1_9BACT|nr:TonB-dependent receptor [Tenuifilum thalassicum]QKG80044.1 TonB-dependent receptor [Tenuifilum thalassicum]